MVSVETLPRPNGLVPAVGLLPDADDKMSVKNDIADSCAFLFCVDSGFVRDVMVHDALGLTDCDTDGPPTLELEDVDWLPDPPPRPRTLG